MERSEPTFVPEWLKSTGNLTTTSHHSDDQGVQKATRNKSFVNINDNDLTRPSISEKTTSSYFRRTSSNGSSHLRSYSSFGRNNRDRDRDRDWDNKEKSDTRHRDFSDPFLPSRFEKEGLRRSHSSVSSKRDSSSWPRKVITTSDKNNNNNNNGRVIGIGNVKIAFERDFPSLGAEEKQIDGEIGRVPSPGLTTAIQSLPIGNAAVIGGDGWTSALAEVPVIVGTNGSMTPVQSNPVSATSNITTTGRNMAETLAQGPPRAQTAPQLSVGTQRLEELAVKQSRQLIPMTPLPKALGSNSSDKPKPKVAQLQLQNSQRPSSIKIEVSKTSSSSSSSSTVGKLHVLKPSRERNGVTVTPIPKDNLSPTAGGKLPNSPLAVPSVAATLEKRASSQAQSRNDFFNLMRKKSLTNNAPGVVATGEKSGGVSENGQVAGSGGVEEEGSEKKVCNGKILYSEEEEARFLRSLGWEDTTEEEEGLTEEEISSFYRDVSKYLNMQAASKIFKGTQTKLLMPMGKNSEISSDSKLES